MIFNFELILSPLGHLQVQRRAVATNESAVISQLSIIEAFEQSQERGILALLAAQMDASWSPAAKYWRHFFSQYLEQLCQYANSESSQLEKILAPEFENLNSWLEKLPPIAGGEYASLTTLESLWSVFDSWCRAQIAADGAGLAGFLSKNLPTWHQVGRVCFRLAENKQDPAYPFAFVATYATSLTGIRELKHQQLNKALQEYAGLANKQVLYNLLKPIHEAAKVCEWVRELTESQDIFYPMAWTPSEAYQLLQSIPQLEACGLVVKCPNWWKKRTKPKVQVTIGNAPSSLFSAKILLQFNVSIALDGETLSSEELAAIYEAPDGLIFLRGQYVEIDKEKLAAALAHWEAVQKDVGDDGVSFIEGMRLLAGTSSDLGNGILTEELHSWSGLEPSSELRELLEKFRHPENIVAKKAGADLLATLRPYQSIGVTWLDFLTELGLGACLADDMGLGKTIQVIALLLIQKAKKLNRPSLLVLPASLLANWKAEMARFAPSLRPLFIHSSQLNKSELDSYASGLGSSLANFDVVLTTYGMLQRQSWLTTEQWHLVILDEAQAIKNHSSEQTKIVKTLKAHAKVALTGTPIENRLGDLWSLYDFICPGLLGNSTRFKKYVKSVASDEKASYAPLRQLVQPYILRRLKTDKSIIADLPDKTEMKSWCTLSKEQLKLYVQTVKEMSSALESAQEGIQRKGLVLAYLTRFKQICNHPAQFLGDMDYDEQRSGKFTRLAELSEEIAARQEKVLVFTQYREMTGPIASYLEKLFGVGGLVLHGGTPVAKRQALVDQFQSEQGPPFFVLSLKAGGTGLNLTAASHVIHFDRWWNPAVENQATDRAFRIGQRRNVLVHKLICQGSIEEKIDQLIETKMTLASDVLQVNGESLLTEMSDKQLLDLVRLDINQIVD